MKGKISIIIPVYKVEKYLCNCIDSVINQSYTNWEMILVDDGSPDQSGAICDEYAKRDQRITVIHKENGGLSSARNAGLDLPPKGDFVTFLDSDDFWHRDYLISLLNACIENDADIAQCGFFYGTDYRFPDTNYSKIFKLYDNHSIFIERRANVLMCGKLFRTSLFDGLRMPVGLYNEDDWTAWKLYYKAKRIMVTYDCYYYYTSNPNSTMGNLKKKPDLRFLKAYDERISFFKKRGEYDLEHVSRWQVCKSLILTYSHPLHTDDDRSFILKKFKENWKEIRYSAFITRKYKLVYFLFFHYPMAVSTFFSSFRGSHYTLLKKFT